MTEYNQDQRQNALSKIEEENIFVFIKSVLFAYLNAQDPKLHENVIFAFAWMKRGKKKSLTAFTENVALCSNTTVK